MLAADNSYPVALRADLVAVHDRDPACTRFLEPVLYFKGFHAIQAHRLAHWLLGHERRDFAFYLQSQASEVFQVDINPAVPMGRGIFIDHGTGVVVGQTAVIEDDVSILQNVTLGGTGKETGDRHPKIRRGVLIGAGAKILGNIEVGRCSRVAAGSVVLKPVPRERDRRRRAGKGGGTGRLRRARTHHGPGASRQRRRYRLRHITASTCGIAEASCAADQLWPVAHRSKKTARILHQRAEVTSDELKKIERYLRRLFANETPGGAGTPEKGRFRGGLRRG